MWQFEEVPYTFSGDEGDRRRIKERKAKKLIFNWVGGVVWCKTHKLHLLYGTDGMLRLLLESPMSKAYESEYVNILPATLDNNDSSLH